jgi:hypothetical protein
VREKFGWQGVAERFTRICEETVARTRKRNGEGMSVPVLSNQTQEQPTLVETI